MFKLACVMALSLSSVAFGLASAQETQPPTIAPAFDMKRCVNMGNALEAPRDEDWGGPLRVDKFAEIKAAGFDTVRIPVRWSAYTGAAPDYTIEPDFLAEVDRAVTLALNEELNVILNIHHFDEIMENPRAELRKLLAIWRQLATHFADAPDDLWFETLNEPNNELQGELMRAAQTTAVLGIRESNPDRVIILGGEEWSGIASLPSNIEAPDSNIVYTFHYYDPFGFTHQFASWVPKELVNKKRGWGSRADKKELANAVDIATGFRDAVGHPVFMGEFGAYDPIDHDERVEYVGAVREAMEGGEIPWCLWSFSNTFALYDDETGWDKDMVQALGVTVPPVKPAK